MPRRTVTAAIEMLLASDWLRVRFAIDRVAALAEIGDRGIELTPDELDLFVRADPRVWFSATWVHGGHVH